MAIDMTGSIPFLDRRTRWVGLSVETQPNVSPTQKAKAGYDVNHFYLFC